MTNRERASHLRQQIHQVLREVISISERLLRARRMIAGSLIERHLGTSEQKRRSSAFYLSWAERGRTRLKYVGKESVEEVRSQTEAWRAYRGEVRRFRAVLTQLVKWFGELGEAQAGGREEGDGK
jgi:hypothetical protein